MAPESFLPWVQGGVIQIAAENPFAQVERYVRPADRHGYLPVRGY